MTATVLVSLALYAVYRRQVASHAAPGLALSSLNFRLEGGPALQALFVPAGEFRTGRSRVRFDELEVSGRFWPPLSDCRADLRGFSMHAAALRPSAAMGAMFELDRLTGVACETVRIQSGEIFLGDSPPMRLDLAAASWSRADSAVSIHVVGLNGQPTSMTLNAQKIAGVSTTGQWNLSGLDVTDLLARVGLAWSSRTDVGLLEFESRGDERAERGAFQISSWVLLGKSRPRPFRLSVPKVTAEFTASDSEIVIRQMVIDHPSYDLLGANPDFLKNFLTSAPGLRFHPKKSAETKVAVSARHQARAEVLPDTFSVRLEALRVDTGAALAMDRPERTRFALKFSDLTVDLSGPASILTRAPNTSIHFRVNDKKEIRWKAITDFSTWPPQFRLTDVR